MSLQLATSTTPLSSASSSSSYRKNNKYDNAKQSPILAIEENKNINKMHS